MDCAANKLATATLQAKMTQYEHYEVWVLDIGEWTLKSSWQGFEVAWAVARVHAGPVHIVRARYESGKEVERKIVAELRVARKDAEPEPPSGRPATAAWV